MQILFGGGGGLSTIAEETVSGVSALDFTGLTDRPMILIVSNVYPSTANQYLHLKCSVDGGSTFPASGHYYETVGTDAAKASNAAQIPLTGNIAGTGNQYAAGGAFHLVGFGVLVKPTVTGSAYYGRGSNIAYGLTVCGRYVDGSPVNAIRLAMSSGNLNGTFTLKGL